MVRSVQWIALLFLPSALVYFALSVVARAAWPAHLTGAAAGVLLLDQNLGALLDLIAAVFHVDGRIARR